MATSGKRIITRGNLDGMACAAVFLDHSPRAEVTFVTSTPKAVQAAADDRRSSSIVLADIPLTPELSSLMAADDRLTLVDHHRTRYRARRAFIDTTRSAAGALHHHLGSSSRGALPAALADLYERSQGVHLDHAARHWGLDRLGQEVHILDHAWRANVEDDAFRRAAAVGLSHGLWPSEVPEILDRYHLMLRDDRWNRALDQVRAAVRTTGPLALLDLRERRMSLYGFGSVALTEAARERGCRCSLVVHSSRGSAVASLRACGETSLDLGLFAERFTDEHGVEGGGHHGSAGARVPLDAVDSLIERLAAAC